MGGLARICRIYGGITAKDANGKTVTWLWDYVNEKPRLETEMTKEEIAASEKEKWKRFSDFKPEPPQ
ncbi:MAG: hypothetical protein V4714_17690 [Bacteroidota bacterium]